MTPGDAAVLIGKCVEWCRGQNPPNDGEQPEPNVVAADRQEWREDIAKIKADLALLVQQRTVKEAYTTKEVADMLGKQEYTVREWCRLGRIAAIKLQGGRGNEGEWRIPHQELIRYQKEGLLSLSPHALLR
jgi:excisionase family DNA binding protein